MNEIDLQEELEDCRTEISMCHAHLNEIGIGKVHWSLLGRLRLLQSERVGGPFESRVVQLVKIIQSLVRVCDRDGVKDTGELTRAKDMLAHKAEAWGIDHV